MNRVLKAWAVVLALAFCLLFAACSPEPSTPKEEQPTTQTTTQTTTPEETTPEETTPEEVTTPEEPTSVVTEPDFSNSPDPDGTKRY